MPAPLQSGAVLRRNTFHEITYASGCERAAAFYRNKDFVFIWFFDTAPGDVRRPGRFCPLTLFPNPLS